jgi:hypothetical protein
MERSRMLGEGETTRLYLRYSKEANSMFLRNYKELVATLKRDAESAEDDDKTGCSDPAAAPETVTPATTPAADPGPGPEAGSRNEANDGATPTTAATKTPTLSPWERVGIVPSRPEDAGASGA